jgi:glycosyltransferase involved in cell wall biosynthesis
MPDAEFVVFCPADSIIRDWFNYPNIRFYETPILSSIRIFNIFQNYFFWKPVLQKENFDYFESFNLPLVEIANTTTFQTIHDIRSVSLENSTLKKIVSRYFHSSAIKRANKIITVSDTMKSEILKSFPYASISRIYNGIDLDFFKDVNLNKSSEVRSRLKLPKRFLLSVGHFEKRKNYSKLIEAIRHLQSDGIFYQLVIIGNDNGSQSLLQRQINSIRLLSDIGTNDFKLIYNMCEYFIFPSFYEGFGIPILEAMASGKSMALSDIPVFQEITQGNYTYFDPNDSFSIASSIKELLNSPERVKNSITYGRNRIHDFDFKNIAYEVKALYVASDE